MTPIHYKLLNPNCEPCVGREGDAGIDLRFGIKTGEGFTALDVGERIEFGTGVAFAIPKGWVGFVVPRSGSGSRYEVKIANTLGVIDSNYRGEVKVAIRNGMNEPMYIEDFQPICQMVVIPHYLVFDNLLKVDELDETNRGDNGFGSSDLLV